MRLNCGVFAVVLELPRSLGESDFLNPNQSF
jgi:hypothetical protein